MKEKLQEYALLAEIIGGIAIVVSLLFVGFQIQQNSDEAALNTRAIEDGVYQNIIGQILTFNQFLIENPETYSIANQENSDLDAEEQVIKQNFYFMITRHVDLAFYQFERGTLSQERMEALFGPLRLIVCTNSYRNFWESIPQNFIPTFRKYINNKIDQC